MKIGLISDTHGYFDETLNEHFAGCSEIWHAGDIGDLTVITSLERIAPVQSVFGNIDDKEMQTRYPENLWLTRDGVDFLITHIAGKPGRYPARVKKLIDDRKPAVLICGHSHICLVKKDEGGLLYINPGAAGQQGFHAMRTVVRLNVENGACSKLEVIELGKRGSLQSR